MKNFKTVVLAIFAITIVSCSPEEVAKKLSNCEKAAELGPKYREALEAYRTKLDDKTCKAYRKIADEYVEAIKGCSTIASAILEKTKKEREKYNCLKNPITKE